MDCVLRKNKARISAIELDQTVDVELEIAKEEAHTTEDNFAISFRPVYYFSRTLGLMPFSMIYDSKSEIQEARVSLFDSIWFVLTICLYLSITYILHQEMNVARDINLPRVLFVGGYTHVILSFVFASVAVGVDLCNRHKVIQILKMFSLFDKQVVLLIPSI